MERVRIASTSTDGEVTLSGLTAEEVKIVHGAFTGGVTWVLAQQGRIQQCPFFQQLPDPVSDTTLEPFWRKPNADKVGTGHKLIEHDDFTEHQSPSLLVQSLCGYDYTPENYRREVAKLESWGFECMRSRRGLDGKFWEIWFLPGIEFAEGDLKAAVEKIERKKEKLAVALRFMQINGSFGTLDASVQRLAMTHRD